jgi:hypothetical protein
MVFTLPDGWLGGTWECVLDTAAERPFEARSGEVIKASQHLPLPDHSMLLLRRLAGG